MSHEKNDDASERPLDLIVSCRRSELEELIMYADTAALILRQNGFPGKADALEARYMPLAKQIGMKAANDQIQPRR